MLNNGLIIDNLYCIIREIGSGGMGVVYLGYHLRLNKYIVLKKIKDSEQNINLLRNEVDTLKGLHHSYLPQVYDFVSYGGNVYTIIDYIEGFDLKYYINSGFQFTEGQLIKWLKQLCEVLDYLHSHNPQVLHSDIKPANIIITNSGDICLIDFGVSLYNSNEVIGLSRNYSSPEQFYNYECLKNGMVSEIPVDSRTDIYSLGATFYHMMTHQMPSITNYPPPPVSDFNTGYSKQLQNIVQKAMAYRPADRFQSARQMLKAVDDMKKAGSRYKGYVLVQLLTSLLSVILVVAGIMFISNGVNKDISSAFQADYSQFAGLVSQGSGEIGEKGREILNNPDYNGLADNDTRAEILHAVGDYYFDAGDYYNAAYNYSECLGNKKSELYYRDYVMALIMDHRIDEAKTEIGVIQSEYPQSPVVPLLDAETAYMTGDYEKAVSIIDAALPAVSGDTENTYTAYVIKGKSYSALDQSDKAIEAFEAAKQQKETPSILRSLGDERIKNASKNNLQFEYKNAFDCFYTISEKYFLNTDDVINLAQSAMLAQEISQYDYCKKKLIEETGKKEDCRVYMILSILSDATADNQTEAYLKKSRELYESLSYEEKGYISSESLEKTKALYKQYCGQEWQ
ncbi:MAG: serine/threonine-protein kinase [Ruminococcus sp.]|nr:serine/threonine-protein kinase [Ruminococcus sp.]